MANWIKSFFEQNSDKALWPVYKRAKHSLHLQRPDGQIEANFTGAPMHFQDILGNWYPLDTKLIAIGSELGAPGLPTRIKLDGTVRIEGGTYSHRSTRVGIFNALTKKFTAVKTIPLGTIQDDKLVAENDVFRRVLTLTETGLREEIIISSLPAGLGTLVNDWAVLETVVTGVSFPDGWLDDFSADGFMFPPPRTRDANGNEAPCKRYARNIGGVQYVYTGVPVSWLVDAVYPVTIDPDFTADTADGWVEGVNATYSTARNTSTAFDITTDNFMVGQRRYYSGGWLFGVYCGFVKFDTSSIPDGATVTQANLKLVCLSDSSVVDFVVEIVEQDWVASDPIAAGNRETVYDACIAAANHIDWRGTLDMLSGTGNQYASANLTTSYVDKGTPGDGLTYYSIRSDRVYAATAPDTDERVQFGAQEWGTAGDRPILTVLYGTGGGAGGYDTYTALLLHMDGADASTTFTDEIGNAITVVGNAQIDTAQSKFGGASGLFDGNGDYLSFAALTLDGDFTIDFWANVSTSNQTYDAMVADGTYATNLIIFISNAGKVIVYYGGSARITGTTTIGSTSVFHHVALVRSSGSLKLYVDGVNEGVSYTTSATMFSSTGYIGWDTTIDLTYGTYITGWLDELRISKGIARWTANFTPRIGPYSRIKAMFGLAIESVKTVNGLAIASVKTFDGLG